MDWHYKESFPRERMDKDVILSPSILSSFINNTND